MTVLDTVLPVRFRPVVFDIYRNIHKGIRSELFAVVGTAGRIDPADDCGVAALADHVRATVHLLESHAAHEDHYIGPVLEAHVPFLAERIGADHHVFDARTAALVALADEVRTPADRREAIHELYIELAAFSGTYLLHQDVEEREVNPALEAAIGPQGIAEVEGQLVGNMPPEELVPALAVMIPAMNVDDRVEMLGGMKANAPAEVFAGVWSLAGSVLTPADHRAVALRIGLG